MKKLIEYSYKNKLSHIPSALSVYDIFKSLESQRDKESILIIGKPFGAQAYFTVWGEEAKSPAIYSGHPKIAYADHTLSSAIPFAIGVALTTVKTVYVLCSDSILQNGETIEALNFIGDRKICNIVIIVDYNNRQACGKLSEITQPEFENIKKKFRFAEIDGHNEDDMKGRFIGHYSKQPTFYKCNTIKGHGIDFMEQNPEYWHHRILTEYDFEQIKKTLNWN